MPLKGAPRAAKDLRAERESRRMVERAIQTRMWFAISVARKVTGKPTVGMPRPMVARVMPQARKTVPRLRQVQRMAKARKVKVERVRRGRLMRWRVKLKKILRLSRSGQRLRSLRRKAIWVFSVSLVGRVLVQYRPQLSRGRQWTTRLRM